MEKGEVNQLTNALQGVSATLHSTTQLQVEAAKAASDAAERYAKSLARATWALMLATGVLALVTVIHW